MRFKDHRTEDSNLKNADLVRTSGSDASCFSVADVGSAALSSKQVTKFVPNWYSWLESSSPGFQV